MQNGKYHSYIKRSGIGKIINDNFKHYITFHEWDQVDNIKIIDGKINLFIPSQNSKLIEINKKMFMNNTTHIWTHDIPDILNNNILKSVTHAFYIIRDVRDVINSIAHYTTSKQVLDLNPQYTKSNIKQIYSDYSLITNWVKEWHEHINSYIDNENKYLCVSLEGIKKNPKQIINDIQEYLNLDFNVEKVVNAIQFKNLKNKSSTHLRNKKSDWRRHFNAKHIQIIKDIAGSRLVDLGYEKNQDW